MEAPTATRVTALLQAWSDGDHAALDRLVPLVHVELRRIARRYMRRERTGHTLQTTALIHEAFIRLVDGQRINWQNRAHFFGISARVMRRVLVDFARERGYRKRGGGARRVALDDVLLVAEAPDQNLVALDDALNALAEVDLRKSRAIELRFFGGLSIEEAALVLEVSPETVKRDCRLAKAWLLRWLTEHDTE
ncbi:MAG TPA: ECF-type sigma factor [Vicinamibacterales bacterium]|nr:ECF-type sigma factor [Vicinamibacterales bacterium]